MPGISPVSSDAYYRLFSVSGVALVIAFLVSWILAETVQRDEGRRHRAHQDSLDFAASDLAKSVLSFFMWFISRHLRSARLSPTVAEIELPTYEALVQEHLPEFPDPEGCPSGPEPCPRLSLGSVRSTLPILVVGLVYALRAYADARTQESIDPFTLSLAFPAVLLGILVNLRITSWRNFLSACWYAGVLQFAGLFMTRDAVIGSGFPSCDLLVAFSLCNSIWISLADLVYGLHCSSSIHLVNTLIFAQSCVVHFLSFLLHPPQDTSRSYSEHFVLAPQALPALEVVKDILAIFIIHQYGAISLGILACLASTFLIAIDTWKSIGVPGSAFLGCLIAILGCGILVHCGKHIEEPRHGFLISARRFFAAATIHLVALGYIVVVISRTPFTDSSDLFSIWGTSSGPPENRSDCRVPESSALIHTETIDNYTHFDNVLLVVFFSHARYDANLDFHREVYSDYFPNIVYIGPASREDKGFAHSYDVLLDSFQSEEDLSDLSNYRMAGRMAHHMLYTALREYDCYDGYLWVPFDTLLNVPRLQQFNQSLFWYHSPWGQPVPNLALGNLTEPLLNVSMHAPPATISPDTSINLTESWRGWGPDWWWGDPHVGVSVCMNAFRKAPEGMRTHLAELTDGQTRLIGGSVDTLYIPGRHRKTFMNVLALFLETNCFLEIATPTTVHLVVPPGEPIQFVDHWWIYQPPFNASFVRQKWAQGYEVDTFHTFHWGERDEDGVWRGDHRHVADVRRLQRESARRQGLGDAFPVNPGAEDGGP